MAHKATTHQQINSSSPAPVVLFGVDENGKPKKAAQFPEKQANLATKAAGHLKLHVLPIVGPAVMDLAGRVPAGRIHANGRGFVPYIRRDLYTKLVAAAGSPSHDTRRHRPRLPVARRSPHLRTAKSTRRRTGTRSRPAMW